MTFKHWQFTAYCFFCITVAPLQGAALSVYKEPMQRIDRHGKGKVETWQQYMGKPLVASFFEPNCGWCQRQQKVLEEIRTQCTSLQVVMVGIRASKQVLKRELLRKKTRFSSYIATPTLVNAIGAETPVPIMLSFNQYGDLVFKHIGFADNASLLSHLQQHLPTACAA